MYYLYTLLNFCMYTCLVTHGGQTIFIHRMQTPRFVILEGRENMNALFAIALLLFTAIEDRNEK